jgi:hypothetical protein
MKMAIFTDGTQDEGAIDRAITEPTPPSFEKSSGLEPLQSNRPSSSSAGIPNRTASAAFGH